MFCCWLTSEPWLPVELAMAQAKAITPREAGMPGGVDGGREAGGLERPACFQPLKNGFFVGARGQTVTDEKTFID